MHITPEMIEDWDTLPYNIDRVSEGKNIFPLPELLIFCGYTIILIIDKVLFDTHALFENDHEGDGHGHGHAADPASAQLAEKGDVRASRIAEREGTQDAMKNYLNPHDRFATRMKASMSRGGAAEDSSTAEQNALFVDGGHVDIDKPNRKLRNPLVSPLL
jgi:hypothetical protein